MQPSPSSPPSPLAVASPAAAFAPRLLSALTDGITGVAVSAILVVVLVQVAGRLLDSPLPWTEELTRACFIWMVFAGIAASMRHADAARVTVILGYLPGFVRRLALPIYCACALVFFGLSAWTGWSMVKQQFAMNERIATLGWPTWVVGIIVPLSSLLAIAGLVQSLRTHRATLSATEPSA